MAFYHKRADFWLSNFGFFLSLFSLLKLHLGDVCDRFQVVFGIWYSYHMALVCYIHYHTCCSVWLLISSTVDIWVNIVMQSNYLPQVKLGNRPTVRT